LKGALVETNPVADWQPMSTAPLGQPLQLAQVYPTGLQPLQFPCSRSEHGWTNAVTGSTVAVTPTYWRTVEQTGAAETAARVRINQLLIGVQLARLYDELLRQPIPPHLSDLLDRLARHELNGPREASGPEH
jgi:hypothetical protein